MTNILKLIGRLVNGLSLASYELDALVYRAEAIKHRQIVAIPNLKKGKATIVDLIGELKFPLLVTGVDFDLTRDDSESETAGNRSGTSNYNGTLTVNIVNRKTKSVIKRLRFPISTYPTYVNEIIIDPNMIYELNPTEDINSITFIGEPIHLREPIVFLNGVTKELQRR